MEEAKKGPAIVASSPGFLAFSYILCVTVAGHSSGHSCEIALRPSKGFVNPALPDCSSQKQLPIFVPTCVQTVFMSRLFPAMLVVSSYVSIGLTDMFVEIVLAKHEAHAGYLRSCLLRRDYLRVLVGVYNLNCILACFSICKLFLGPCLLYYWKSEQAKTKLTLT